MTKAVKPIVKAPEKQDKTAGFIVVSPFRDKDNFDLQYEIGDDVSHLHPERLGHLVSLNLVELK